VLSAITSNTRAYLFSNSFAFCSAGAITLSPRRGRVSPPCSAIARRDGIGRHAAAPAARHALSFRDALSASRNLARERKENSRGQIRGAHCMVYPEHRRRDRNDSSARDLSPCALELRQIIQNLFERQREIRIRILKMHDRRAQTITKRLARGRAWFFQRRLNIASQMLEQLPRFVVKRLRLLKFGVKLREGLVKL